MARSIYSYTDPVMDFILPTDGYAKDSRLFSLARVAYLPLLVAVVWTWGSLVGYAEDPTIMAHDKLPFGFAAADLTWMLPVASLVLGWVLWRTSAGPIDGRKEVLVMWNIFGTGAILVLCLINMLRILFISGYDMNFALSLASVWFILAGGVAATAVSLVRK